MTTLTCSSKVIRNTEQDEPLVDYSDDALVAFVERLAKKRSRSFLTWHKINIDNETQLNELNILDNQVGGLSHKRFRRLSSSSNLSFVCKPLHFDHRGFREVAFYESVQLAVQHGLVVGSPHDGHVTVCRNLLHLIRIRTGSNPFGGLTRCQDRFSSESSTTQHKSISCWKRILHEAELLRQLSIFLPAYRGLHTTTTTAPQVGSSTGSSSKRLPTSEISSYLLLEDVTHGYRQPCILDLKLGTQTFERGSLHSKQVREDRKYPQQRTLGARIVGMRVVSDENNTSTKSHSIPTIHKRTSRSDDGELITVYNKYFGFSISNQAELTFAILKIFLCGANKIRRMKLANDFLVLVRQLKEWFLINDVFLFVSSSILLVYEGSTISCLHVEKKPTLRVIDLAHMRTTKSSSCCNRSCSAPASPSDASAGYLVGLRTIEDILEQELQP